MVANLQEIQCSLCFSAQFSCRAFWQEDDVPWRPGHVREHDVTCAKALFDDLAQRLAAQRGEVIGSLKQPQREGVAEGDRKVSAASVRAEAGIDAECSGLEGLF